ncbi:uncharacterized protein LOC133868029 [Alnus glutinosa]|uniref:uncharacterized protein LOC133868029 n=1 Tax=Alnus glutinosa TaxID=3517 RepID=UPI002D795184|nr:uncharacterized protein LOC133868029 [Alnus glutinosa]
MEHFRFCSSLLPLFFCRFPIVSRWKSSSMASNNARAESSSSAPSDSHSKSRSGGITPKGRSKDFSGEGTLAEGPLPHLASAISDPQTRPTPGKYPRTVSSANTKQSLPLQSREYPAYSLWPSISADTS